MTAGGRVLRGANSIARLYIKRMRQQRPYNISLFYNLFFFNIITTVAPFTDSACGTR